MSDVGTSEVERIVMSREQAIQIFFRAIDHDDMYWTDLVEDLCVYGAEDELISWPNQWDMGRALGFTNKEMEIATGVEKGRLKELGLQQDVKAPDQMRYFFFTYSVHNDAKHGSGNIHFEHHEFPSKKEVVRIARDRAGGMDVVITGWKEFDSKEDYDNFRWIGE